MLCSVSINIDFCYKVQKWETIKEGHTSFEPQKQKGSFTQWKKRRKITNPSFANQSSLFLFPNLTENPLNFVVRAKVKKPLFMPLEIRQLYQDREGQFFDPRHGARWEIQ